VWAGGRPPLCSQGVRTISSPICPSLAISFDLNALTSKHWEEVQKKRFSFHVSSKRSQDDKFFLDFIVYHNQNIIWNPSAVTILWTQSPNQIYIYFFTKTSYIHYHIGSIPL
jgi:hypothetical protein